MRFGKVCSALLGRKQHILTNMLPPHTIHLHTMISKYAHPYHSFYMHSTQIHAISLLCPPPSCLFLLHTNSHTYWRSWTVFNFALIYSAPIKVLPYSLCYSNSIQIFLALKRLLIASDKESILNFLKRNDLGYCCLRAKQLEIKYLVFLTIVDLSDWVLWRSCLWSE